MLPYGLYVDMLLAYNDGRREIIKFGSVCFCHARDDGSTVTGAMSYLTVALKEVKGTLGLVFREMTTTTRFTTDD